MNPGQKIVDVTDEFLDQPDHQLALRMTLLLLLFHGFVRTWAQIPIQFICGLMLVSVSLHRNRWLWLCLLALVAVPNAQDWYFIDNHKYLITYWTLACCLSLYSREPGKFLAQTGRVLLGLVFALAVMWKLLGGEFLNGKFLTFTLLGAPGLAQTVAAFLGLSPGEVAYNLRALAWLKLYPEAGSGFTLSAPPHLHAVGLAWSYATLLVESAVAGAFLLHRPQWLDRNRNDVLIIFCLATYWLLPIAGFAFVLLVMGLSQCGPEQKESRRWYVWMIVIIQVLAVPFEAFVPTGIE